MVLVIHSVCFFEPGHLSTTTTTSDVPFYPELELELGGLFKAELTSAALCRTRLLTTVNEYTCSMTISSILLRLIQVRSHAYNFSQNRISLLNLVDVALVWLPRQTFTSLIVISDYMFTGGSVKQLFVKWVIKEATGT